MNIGNANRLDDDDRLAKLGWILHAAGAAVSMILVVVLYVGVVRPLASEGANVQFAIDSTKMYQTAGPAIATRHADALASLAAEQRIEADRAARIPAAARESELLAQLTELSRASNLEIVAYQPAGSARHGTIQALSVELNGNATYDGMCRFLAGLESLPRLCHVTRLNVISPPQADSMLQLDLTLQVYFGSAEAPAGATLAAAPRPGARLDTEVHSR